MATWHETVSNVSRQTPGLSFGDRSKIAKELWAPSKAEKRWAGVYTATLCVLVLGTMALLYALYAPVRPRISTGVRLRDIQGLVRSLPGAKEGLDT